MKKTDDPRVTDYVSAVVLLAKSSLCREFITTFIQWFYLEDDKVTEDTTDIISTDAISLYNDFKNKPILSPRLTKSKSKKIVETDQNNQLNNKCGKNRRFRLSRIQIVMLIILLNLSLIVSVILSPGHGVILFMSNYCYARYLLSTGNST